MGYHLCVPPGSIYCRARLSKAEREALVRLPGTVLRRIGVPSQRRWIYDAEPSAELFAVLRRKRCALWAVDEATAEGGEGEGEAERSARLWRAKRAFFPGSASDETLARVAVQMLEDMNDVASALAQLEEGMRGEGRAVLVRVNGYFKGGAVVSLRVRCGGGAC